MLVQLLCCLCSGYKKGIVRKKMMNITISAAYVPPYMSHTGKGVTLAEHIYDSGYVGLVDSRHISQSHTAS